MIVMEKEVSLLVEMGATRGQARAALKKYKDVMQAAEKIFDGDFSEVLDDETSEPEAKSSGPGHTGRSRLLTPQDDESSTNTDTSDGSELESDAEIDFDDMEFDTRPLGTSRPSADPYAGIFFSKDRKEEVIEVEEEPEEVTLPGYSKPLKLITQGQWMKGCPEGNEQSYLFALYSGLSEGFCACPEECGFKVKREKADFFTIYPNFETYISQLKQIIRKSCPKCRSSFCLACGERANNNLDRYRRLPKAEDPLYHCSNLQGVVLGVGLTMLEQMFLEQTENTSHSGETPQNSKKRKSSPSIITPGDENDGSHRRSSTSKGKKSKGGVGYDGSTSEDVTGQTKALNAQNMKDVLLENLLKELRVFLPNVHREKGVETSDYLPHPSTLAHLRRRFNFVSSTLLRNDSLSDMSDRSAVYFELFEWLEAISNHEALASMMAMPIMVVSSVKSASTKRISNGTQLRERTILYEGSSGPRELLEAIVIQAQAACKSLETSTPQLQSEELNEEQKHTEFSIIDIKGKGKANGKDVIIDPLLEDNMRLYSFCKRIIATAAAIDRSLKETKGQEFLDRLIASLPKPPTSAYISSGLTLEDGMLAAGMTDKQLRLIYDKWATRVRFEYCDLALPPGPGVKVDADYIPHYKHSFNSDARCIAGSENPKRALSIAKELAVLTTSLPASWDSSIFLRVDESRVDLIKCLITGPQGTPYHNGCYLFDIFLTSTFNKSPPKVRYLTTNGGRYRFNPNLYADGKVCLSLLGTWSGPGWISGKSTLLQVLISIQSMILCDEPFLNEPGWSNEAGTSASRAYSANVRRMVVQTAMLDNLKNPPEPFADVIRTHFRLKSRSLIVQLDDWLEQDDGKIISGEYHDSSQNRTRAGSSSLFRRNVDELKNLLYKLQTKKDDSSSSKTF